MRASSLAVRAACSAGWRGLLQTAPVTSTTAGSVLPFAPQSRLLSPTSFQAFRTRAASLADVKTVKPAATAPASAGSFLAGLRLLREQHIVPLVLGFAGAIPFLAFSPLGEVLLPLPGWLEGTHVRAQAAYGASILSFLGAVHWGLAIASHGATVAGLAVPPMLNAARYVWGVTPSLISAGALLLPPLPCLATLFTGLGAAYIVDLEFAKRSLLPRWYMSLRLPLTIVAMLSIGATMGGAMLPRPRPVKVPASLPQEVKQELNKKT
eukprot:jgi/Chlat1/5683/Chrsp37S05468